MSSLSSHAEMLSVGQNRQYRWQDSAKSSYAARFDPEEWEKHEEEIKSLHAKGRTKKQILLVLRNQHGFRPSYGQLRKRLGRWLSKTTKSIARTSSSPSVSQLLPEIPEHSLEHSNFQPTETDPVLTKDEEDVFKAFTSILDDANETADIKFEAPKDASIDDFEGKANVRRKHPARRKAMPSSSLSTNLNDDQSIRSFPFPFPSSPKDQMITQPSSTTLEVDSDPEEQPTILGPLLPNQSSTSTKSKAFEDSSIELYRQSRNRKRYYSEKDLNPDLPRTTKKARRRRRFTCCACEKVAHSKSCESCQHKQCVDCRPSST